MAVNRPPRWQTFSLLDNSTVRDLRRQLKDLNGQMNKVNKLLEQGEKLTDQLNTYVELLRRLEQMMNRGIWAFLDVITDSIQKILNNVKSTGIYALDLFSYHFQEVPKLPEYLTYRLMGQEWYSLASNSKTSQALTDPYSKLLKEIQSILVEVSTSSISQASNKSYIDNCKKYTSVIESYISSNGIAVPNIAAMKKDLVTDMPGSFIENNHSLATKIYNAFIGFTYKVESYNEWIEVICNAFTDPDDVPAQDIISRIKTISTSDKKGEMQKEQLQPIILKAANAVSKFENEILRCGRPAFGDNSYMQVVLIGFSLFDFHQFLTVIKAFSTLFKDFSGIYKFSGISKESLKTLGTTLGTVTANKTITKEQMQQNFNSDRSNLKTGTPPNFFGINLNMILPEVFDFLDRFNKALKNTNIKLSTSVFDVVTEYLIVIKKTIKNIKEFINIIQGLLEIIEALVSLSQCFILSFDTNKGINGVIDKIKNSEGFYQSKMTQSEVIKQFGLENNFDAQIAMMAGNPDKVNAMIDNIKQYQDQLNLTLDKYQTEYDIYYEENLSLTTDLNQLQTLEEQCAIFDTELVSAGYYSLIATINAQNIIYDGQITSYTNSYTAALNAERSRKWVVDQIAIFATELIDVPDPNASPFNVLNATEQASVQAKIDALDAQYADPLAPIIPDYTQQRALLSLQLTSLQTQKTNHDAKYLDLYTRYSAALVLIDQFIASITILVLADLVVIDDKIDDITDDINTLKGNRTAYYDNYVIDRNANLADQASDLVDIAADQTDINTYQNDKANKEAELAYRTAINPADPQIPILQAQIAQLVIDIAAANADIVSLRADIVSLQAALVILDNDMIAYDLQAEKDQEDKYLELMAYTYWRQSEYYRLYKETAELQKLNYNTAQQIILSGILNTTITTYIPALGDPGYSNIIAELTLLEGFDVGFPDTSRVTNSIAKTENELQKTTLQLDAKLSEVEGVQEQLNTTFSTETIEENAAILSVLDNQENIFNPDEKMYFGGLLLCFGFPDDTMSLNLSEAVAKGTQEFQVNNGTIQEVVKQSDEIGDNVKKVFNMIFK